MLTGNEKIQDRRVKRVPITEAAAAALQPSGAKVFLWDEAVPGFAVMCAPAGSKSYVIQYRNDSRRTKRLKIGHFGRLSLEEAREQARRLLAAVDAGRDPATETQERRAAIRAAGAIAAVLYEEKKRAKAQSRPRWASPAGDAAKAATTLKEIAEFYFIAGSAGLPLNAAGAKKTAGTLKIEERRARNQILPRIGGTRINALTKEDVEGFASQFSTAKHERGRMMQVLRALLDFAVMREIIKENPAKAAKTA